MTTIPPIPPTSLTILLADDDAIGRATLRGLIERAGHRVDLARNGREALEATAARAYDLVLLDMQMPEMDGPEAASWIRRRRARGLPWIIGLSAEPAPDDGALSSLDDFLLKPVRLRDLVRALESFERCREPASCGSRSSVDSRNLPTI